MAYSKTCRKSGVYRITNAINGKFYVGSSISIAERWNKHRKSLRRGKHHSKHLQAAWSKYGESAFVFSVLLECAPSDVSLHESHEIRGSGCLNPVIGYNCSDMSGGGRSLKPVAAYSSDGMLYKHWSLPADASAELGLSSSSGIRKACKMLYGKSAGYYWRYFTGSPSGQIVLVAVVEKYHAFSEAGGYLQGFVSFSDVVEKYGIAAKTLAEVLKGSRRKKTKGLYIIQAEDRALARSEVIARIEHARGLSSRLLLNLKAAQTSSARKRSRPVNMLHEGVLLASFDSIKDAATRAGITSSTVLVALKDPRKTAGGYRWEYA